MFWFLTSLKLDRIRSGYFWGLCGIFVFRLDHAQNCNGFNNKKKKVQREKRNVRCDAMRYESYMFRGSFFRLYVECFARCLSGKSRELFAVRESHQRDVSCFHI